MINEQTLINLVRDWTGCLQYQEALKVCCKIADYVGLQAPKTYQEYRDILVWVDSNYPNVYLEATKAARQF
ncbi:hypothetical protein DSM106972_097520 [Dulcicalothrix desertica PCC 7102]|uniref:Uncharacterized protein n=1 Tax=Dulcicalothrix desertica PCC 7102 TaxID=232991 RepID=A0A433UH13_9CYAN|nr:hypothetical protein [Dulcicalothrix desertica]RUS93120.1 hypothetical protein DSM106972_097520 [Dulcicalothrix desertica PCC 7102]TWH61196.1 hypothetical protein CAL7102_01051 [Dulcicalothrix desertica PCC 7102]